MNKRIRMPSRLLFFLGLTIGPVHLYSTPGILTNKDGRSFEGQLEVVGEDTLQLAVEAGEGQASYLFRKDTIAGLEFLDAETVEVGLEAYEQQQFEAAISYLEGVHRSRSPFFKVYAHPALAGPSVALGEAYLQMGRYADATGVAGILLGGHFPDPEIQVQADELRLKAFFGLERWDETELLAKRWCEVHQPFDESALGWWILGAVHLARGEVEKARWVSLQPIAFSSQYPKAYLQECYHVVIASWVEEKPERALRLFQEYQDRGFSWPEGHDAALKRKLLAFGLSENNQSEETDESAPLEMEAGAPEKDLNLPLATVRKLTIKQETRQLP